MVENDLFAQAYAELDSPNRQPGLWARCFAEAGGEESKAKAAYISERVKGMTSTAVSTGFCPNCSHECQLRAEKCEQCGALFGSGNWQLRTHATQNAQQPTQQSYSSPPQPLPQTKSSRWWLWIAIPSGLFAAVLVFGASVNNTPEYQTKVQDKNAIDLCWSEQKRLSLTPSDQRFIAGACERMENTFTSKYGTRP